MSVSVSNPQWGWLGNPGVDRRELLGGKMSLWKPTMRKGSLGWNPGCAFNPAKPDMVAR